MDRNFEFGGRKFKLRKIDAFRQFHIVRRIGPMLAELLPALKTAGKFEKLSAAEIEKLPDSEKFELIAKMVPPIMTGLSKLSDDDANRVLFGLLSAAEVQQSTGNWADVATDEMLMIQDLELPALIQIAGRAFMFNLSGFFGALP